MTAEEKRVTFCEFANLRIERIEKNWRPRPLAPLPRRLNAGHHTFSHTFSDSTHPITVNPAPESNLVRKSVTEFGSFDGHSRKLM